MRFFIPLFMLFALAYAKPTMVDGISFFVNESPVTLYQLFKEEKQYGITQDEAIENLIRKKLEDEEINRFGIKVGDAELRAKITQIAERNALSYAGLKSRFEAQNISWKHYEEEIRREAKVEELSRKIVRESMKMPAESEIKSYYELRKDRYSMPTSVEVIQYSSENQNSIQNRIKNPYTQLEDVQAQETSIDLNTLPPEFAMMLATTPIGAFTEIISAQNSFITFYIKNKRGLVAMPYEQIKNAVINEMMSDSEQRILSSHFEKLRAQAEIRVVRLP